MNDFLRELNKQAETLVEELRAAKKAAKENKGVKAAYHKGRAEELEKWWRSVEAMIEKIIERDERKKSK